MKTSEPRLSVSLPYWQDRPPLDALAVADETARLGFDRLWVGEMATFDAFALATAIGARVPDLPLCVGPLAVDVRTPVAIALGAASVAALTGARVDLAIGTSSTVVVEGWHGRTRLSPAIHLEETARIVRQVAAGRKADFDGRVERARGFRLRLPATDPALVIAAFGPQALGVAAREADGVVLNLVTPQQVSRCVSVVRAAAESAGRPCPRVSVWVTAAVDPSAADLESFRRAVVGYLAAPGYADMFADAGFATAVEIARSGATPKQIYGAVTDDLAAVIGAFGDAGAVARRLAAYRDSGADEIVVVPATSADDPGGARTLDVVARACAPAAEILA
ncbi:LLM class F420-dependent oxidoreductase [Rhodococcus sp. BE178]|uniref:LLM class F420-dependent oxidoreductase n=1 Tax=Rhodococcus sp. BE178 TaxID=2817737 RepID=UPI003D1A7B2A